MIKSDRCDRCPDEDTTICDTCNPNDEEQHMELTYTFTLSGGVYNIEGLHINLDTCVMAMGTDLGFDIIKSTLESPDKIVEHDYNKKVFD